jgi:hypothetical protein
MMEYGSNPVDFPLGVVEVGGIYPVTNSGNRDDFMVLAE